MGKSKDLLASESLLKLERTDYISILPARDMTMRRFIFSGLLRVSQLSCRLYSITILLLLQSI